MRASWLLALALGCAACAEPSGDEAPRGHSIVWVVADGLRFDAAQRMESYVALRGGATTYDLATAASSDCVSSLATMLTGLLPTEHGAHVTRVVRNGRAVYHEARLSPGNLTLAEALREAGYATRLVTSNLRHGDESLGLRQGFDEPLLAAGRAERVNERVEASLDALRAADRPFLLVIDYADTLQPYAAAPGDEDPEPGSGLDSQEIARRLDPLVLAGEPLPEGELELLGARYADGVASLDAGLARLVTLLRERGLYDECVLVLTSDHGAALGEHALLNHGRGVYEELVHVPLLIKASGQSAPGRVAERWSLARLAGRVLELADTDVDASAFTTHEDDDAVFAEQWYSHPADFGKPWSDRFDQVLRACWRGRWKLVESDEGTDRLYDLGSAGAEDENRIEAHAGIAADLAARITRVFGGS